MGFLWQKVFKWKEDCLFCAKSAVEDPKHPTKKNLIHTVATDDINATLLKACAERNDEWSHIVQGRMLTISDLFAADAVYHHNCYTKFKRGDPPPGSQKNQAGRKVDADKMALFEQMCIDLLENGGGELYTLDDLIEYMDSCTKDSQSSYCSAQIQNVSSE